MHMHMQMQPMCTFLLLNIIVLHFTDKPTFLKPEYVPPIRLARLMFLLQTIKLPASLVPRA